MTPADSTSRKSSPLRIGLVSHDFWSPNLGVQALTLAHVGLVDRALGELEASANYVLIGHIRPNDPPSRADVRAVELGLRSLIKGLTRRDGKLRQAISDCDLVLDIGEGDSFSDIYGYKRFATQSLVKILALRCGVPLILSPQTIGPFNGRLTRRLAGSLIERAATVYARDPVSAELVQRISKKANLVEVTDVAFALPYTTAELPPSTRVRVGVNISGLLFAEVARNRRSFGMQAGYRDAMLQVLDALSRDTSVELHLVPHVLSPAGTVDDDRTVCADLARRFGATLAPMFTSAKDAKGYIAAMDFFTGARMHACIAALSARVPSVPIAYSMKATALFQSLGYPAVVDSRATSTSDMVTAVLTGVTQRDRLRTETEKAADCAEVRLAAYVDHLSGLLERRLGQRL